MAHLKPNTLNELNMITEKANKIAYYISQSVEERLKELIPVDYQEKLKELHASNVLKDLQLSATKELAEFVLTMKDDFDNVEAYNIAQDYLSKFYPKENK